MTPSQTDVLLTVRQRMPASHAKMPVILRGIRCIEDGPLVCFMGETVGIFYIYIIKYTIYNTQYTSNLLFID